MLNLTQKEHIQVYIHKRSYPSEAPDEHEYALGAISEKTLLRLFRMYYMKEIFTAANPYQYVPQLDQIIYYPHFRHTNKELFEAENREKFDTIKV